MNKRPTSTLFSRACRGDPVERPPVWMMRQAGRYMPEYQAVRADAGGFLQLCRSPAHASQATLDAQRILGTDAAIIFSDITLPGVAMGLDLTFSPGPIFTDPVRSAADIKRLRAVNPAKDMDFVMEAIRLTREGLPSDISLIGFVGAPFTLAGYMVEGTPSRNWNELKRLLYSDRKTFDALVDRVTEVVSAHARAQYEAGCDAIQIFDSTAGELAPRELHDLAFAAARRCFDSLADLDIPKIYFARGITHYLEGASEVGCTVLGVDWTVRLAEAKTRIGHRMSLMGNLDPTTLFASKDVVERRTLEVIEEARGARGYIFNLGHGILPPTPVENAKALVDTVKTFRW